MTFAEPSIKSLFLEMRFDGQVLASGSGFLVQSARHRKKLSEWPLSLPHVCGGVS